MRFFAVDWKSNLPSKGTTIDLSGIFQWVYMIMGIAALMFLLYGVIIYISSQGEPGKMQRGKSIITYALVGLAIVILASAITFFVVEALK